MFSVRAYDVSEAFTDGLVLLRNHGQQQQSRNGPVLSVPQPVCTTYYHPNRRVLFSPLRDANPFFHFMEALWMLDGRDDVAFVAQFNAGMVQYSDNGVSFHGAYGARWRSWFEFDQLETCIKLLRQDPTSRQVVLTMWDPVQDLGRHGKDVPCNTAIYFRVVDGSLNMTVVNRSNDAIWGCYGANAVHMSMLQEYVASAVGVALGVYHQITNNLHVYTDKYSVDTLQNLSVDADIHNAYKRQGVHPMAMVSTPISVWNLDLMAWMDDPAEARTTDPFFYGVAQPMYRAWRARKVGDVQECYRQLASVQAADWRVACTEWVQRKEHARLQQKQAATQAQGPQPGPQGVQQAGGTTPTAPQPQNGGSGA